MPRINRLGRLDFPVDTPQTFLQSGGIHGEIYMILHMDEPIVIPDTAMKELREKHDRRIKEPWHCGSRVFIVSVPYMTEYSIPRHPANAENAKYFPADLIAALEQQRTYNLDLCFKERGRNEENQMMWDIIFHVWFDNKIDFPCDFLVAFTSKLNKWLAKARKQTKQA